MTGPIEPPADSSPPPTDAGRGVDFPEPFQDYPVTFLSSLGRADMAGATPEEQAGLRASLYDGWIRPNEYDENGNLTFGPNERWEARQQYKDDAATLQDRTDGDVDTSFDWDAWREEYEEAAGY